MLSAPRAHRALHAEAELSSRSLGLSHAKNGLAHHTARSSPDRLVAHDHFLPCSTTSPYKYDNSFRLFAAEISRYPSRDVEPILLHARSAPRSLSWSCKNAGFGCYVTACLSLRYLMAPGYFLPRSAISRLRGRPA